MSNLKLTDAQRVVLANAGARDTRLVLPLPKSLTANKAASSRVLQSLVAKGLVTERRATQGEEVWRTNDDGRTTLEIAQDGLAAIGISEAEVEAPTATKAKSRPNSKGTKKSKRADHADAASVSLPKPSSKLGQLIAALRNKKGATIDDLMKATGWQAHSVRGAISGALKKKLELRINSSPVERRGRVYRIET